MRMRHYLLSSRAQIFPLPSPTPTPSPHRNPTILTHRHRLPPVKISRRDLAAATATAALPLLLPTHLIPSRALADDSPNVCSNNGTFTISNTAFLDIAIDGEPAGRITVGLYGAAAPLGSARFAALVTGAAGISYRRKEFVKITPGYIQHAGVRSYGVDAELARRTGSDLAADGLMAEWEARCPGVTAGAVGLVVRDPAKPPPKAKLVARKGKLEVDEEEVRADPNGTEFVIATRDSPELDSSALVVGRVVAGMEVVERIAKVKTVQENTASPYFRVAKLIGDKRAVVAERGFNRPYSKVIVTNCGLID